MRAALYLRVSTEDQARNGWSIEGQYNDLRDYCDKKEYKVVRVYKDEGFSGSNLDRPALERLLADGSEHEFDVVVVWKYDRLSRDDIDFPLLIHNLKKFDVCIESINEPTSNDGSPYNEFIVGLLGLMASLERKIFLMRSKMGQKTRLKNGLYLGGTPPYGYKYNPGVGELEFHPVESKYVKIIFKKYLEMKTLSSVRIYLEREGAPTKRGARWSAATVGKILYNRIYIGEYKFGDTVIQKENYRLVSDTVFENVQKILISRRKYSPTFKYKINELNKYKDELYFSNETDNQLVQEFLQEKAMMPSCPYCKEQTSVRKSGSWHSNIVGEVDKFYCKSCKKTFHFYPEKIDKDAGPCPECGSNIILDWGLFTSKIGNRFKTWKCKKCGKQWREKLI